MPRAKPPAKRFVTPNEAAGLNVAGLNISGGAKGRKKAGRKSLTNVGGNSAGTSGAPVKRRTRYKPGVLAMKEIRKYQKTSNLLLRKMPFARVVRKLFEFCFFLNLFEIHEGPRSGNESLSSQRRIEISIVGARVPSRGKIIEFLLLLGSFQFTILQAAEAYLVRLFENANLCAIHGNRVTIMPRDIILVRRLLGESTGY